MSLRRQVKAVAAARIAVDTRAAIAAPAVARLRRRFAPVWPPLAVGGAFVLGCLAWRSPLRVASATVGSLWAALRLVMRSPFSTLAFSAWRHRRRLLPDGVPTPAATSRPAP